MFYVVLDVPCRTVFNVSPDTHVDNISQSEQTVLDGTSKWSCKIAVTGRSQEKQVSLTVGPLYRPDCALLQWCAPRA